ncbi:MAG: response regulator, partial [Saprospiraceae bacterium]
KNRFFANIAHELRTPLTLITGPISTILQDNNIPITTQQTLSIVNRNVNYLKQLTNQILDLSKKEVEDLTIQISTFKFSDVLKALVEDFQSYANHQKINFITPNNIENNIELSTDGEKLFIILKNLLSNAFKYTNSGGQVAFNYLEIDDNIQVTIQDTGRGITKENLENIFKRYFQNSDTNAPIEGGTGIGLAVCKEYIEQLNGTIRVNSELGKGSTFIIQFPKKAIGESRQNSNLSFLQLIAIQPITLKSATPIISNEMPTLMIVEDNLEICQYLQTILQTDYQIAFANNGVDALKQLETLNPDLIITDLMMPLMDGFELIENLKKQDKFRAIPIITLTARSEMKDKLHALRIGVDDYLIKPFNNDELKVRIENLLENRANRTVSIEEEVDTIEENTQSDIEPKMTESTISQEDAAWLKQLETVVNEEITNINFNANQLIISMAMSRSQLYRKVKRLAGLTPKEYIDQVRYHQARQFLENKTYSSVKRIAYEVGFKDEKNFARNFKKRYGKYPSKYLE